MKNNCIKFIKKWYQLFIILAFAIVGAILMFYGVIKVYPLQYLERDYQIFTFGYYDSSIKYLKDVDDSLHYFNCYIGIGFSILFADLIYALFSWLDMLNTKMKNKGQE